MIKIKSIKFKRAEGPHSGDFSEHTFKFFSDCSAHIRRIADTAPDAGGYDKCDFNVIWENDQEYSGRFDMKREDMTNDDHIQKQIKGFVTYLSENDDETKADALEFLAAGYEGIN